MREGAIGSVRDCELARARSRLCITIASLQRWALLRTPTLLGALAVLPIEYEGNIVIQTSSSSYRLYSCTLFSLCRFFSPLQLLQFVQLSFPVSNIHDTPLHTPSLSLPLHLIFSTRIEDRATHLTQSVQLLQFRHPSHPVQSVQFRLLVHESQSVQLRQDVQSIAIINSALAILDGNSECMCMVCW